MPYKDLSLAMKNAEASIRMEGFEVTPFMREQCRRVLDGEISTAELLKSFANNKTARRTKP